MPLFTGARRALVAAAQMSTLQPLDPNAASQPLTAAYSMRKVVPGYAGNPMQGANSALTTTNIGFDANGNINVAQIQAAMAAGDGTTYTAKIFYDQTANANNFSSTVRPAVTLGALTNRAGVSLPGIDFTSKSINMTTASSPIDFSKNVAIFLVYGTFGFGAATGTFPRNPAVYSGSSGSVLGFGTAGSAGIIGAATASGETVWGGSGYPYFGATFVEASTPTNARIRNEWYNWKAGALSAGADTRQMYANRGLATPAAGVQRMVLGNGPTVGMAHNGPVFEMLVYVSNTPLSDAECLRIALSQRQFWGDLAAGRFPTRYRILPGGQSLLQYMGTTTSASTGVLSDNAADRVLSPELTTLLGGNTDGTKEIYAGSALYGTLAIGGTSLLAGSSMTPNGSGGTSWLPYDGTTAAQKFWWDQYHGVPGPCLQSWRANSATALTNFGFDKTCIIWDQGQADALTFQANGEVANYTFAIYKASLESVFAQMRAWIGTNVPILLQPIGRQSGADGPERQIRALQQQVAAEIAGVTIIAETSFLDRQDTVHFAAGPADPLGFDRAAHQQARAYDAIICNSGRKYLGPYVASCHLVDGVTIDVTLAWSAQGGGFDFTPSSGIVGFEVNDSSGGKTITGAIRQAANKARLTVSAPLTTGVTVNYNPTPSALDNTRMVLDNNPDWPMPLQAAFAVAAS